MAHPNAQNYLKKRHEEREARDTRIWQGTATDEDIASRERDIKRLHGTTPKAGGYWKNGNKTSQTQQEKEKLIARKEANSREDSRGYPRSGESSQKTASKNSERNRKLLEDAFKKRVKQK